VLLGPVGLGGLKAAQTLVSGPSGVLIQAGGSIGLPEASRAFADRGWRGLTSVARLVAVAGILSFIGAAAVVAIWGRTLLSHVYGPSFAHLELVAVLFGVAYIFMGFSLGPILVLKSTRQTHWLLVVQFVSLAVSIAATVGLCLAFGVTGAAIATVIAYAATAVTYRWCQHRVRHVVSPPELEPGSSLTLDDLDKETSLAFEGQSVLADDSEEALQVPREVVP
jgi:O-antigen/teichoic acid export membrane protein